MYFIEYELEFVFWLNTIGISIQLYKKNNWNAIILPNTIIIILQSAWSIALHVIPI